MDINSLLSPQDTPAPSPSPRPPSSSPRRPKAKSATTKASPLSQMSVTSNPQSQSPVAFARPAAPSTMNAPQSHTPSHAISTPPHNSPRISRQSSTPGMDTLAELAAMQHHQQTIRANASANGVRNNETYEGQTVAVNIRPSLEAIARTHSGSRSSLDISMADAPTQTPPPRSYASSSLNESDLRHVMQLTAYLVENPNAYESHVKLIKIFHQGLVSHSYSLSGAESGKDPHDYDLLKDLQQATDAMASRFSLGEELWIDRLQDQQLLARSVEDCLNVLEEYGKAVTEEVGSTDIWILYGEWMLSLYSAAHPSDQGAMQLSKPLNKFMRWTEDEKLMAVEVFGKGTLLDLWRRGAEETKYNINNSYLIWDKYTDLLLQDLSSSPSREAIEAIKMHFIDRLEVPQAAWEETSQKFSNFISTYDNAAYEQIMVSASQQGADAKSKYGARETHEIRLQRAVVVNERVEEWSIFNEYLEWEMSQNRKRKVFSYELTNALFQRAILRFPTDVNIWEDYLMFLGDVAGSDGSHWSPLTILGRACRHCPWSGTLWSQYIQAAERDDLPFPDIGQIKHKATSTGLLDSTNMEDVLKIHRAWCSFLGRQAFKHDSDEDQLGVAEVGIIQAIEDMNILGKQKHGEDYAGDPKYRLERHHINFLSMTGNYRTARDIWRSLIARQGDHYDFWLQYYMWEMLTWARLQGESGSNEKPAEATKVLCEAAKRTTIDWPEKILESYLTHCEQYEDVTVVHTASLQCRRASKIIAKRREAEAEQVPEQQPTETELQNHDFVQAQQNTKRKREEDDGNQAEVATKKSRPDDTGLQNAANGQSLSTESTLKRDRENTTVIVKNLPSTTTEKRIRNFFKECGTINTLKLSTDNNGASLTATIEFESKDDVLTAQTRDMKIFEGNAIEVQVGSGTTLYVTNFPPTADESYIRNTFSPYGEIVDIRFPSLKYNTHRRFCYVQFRTSSQAKSATVLDEKSLDGGLKLVAKMSDPNKKEKRHGAMHEGRELYVGNVDWEASENDIKDIFSKYGTVENVRIPKNIAGKSKGTAFVVFSNKNEAEAAQELNNVKFKSRLIHVSISTSNPTKRKATTIITPRASASPAPEQNQTAASPSNAQSPRTITKPPSQDQIASRTVALLNIPDTVNDARIRALMEPHGALVKIVLRPDHQGAIVEYQDVSSAGRAALAVEGHEIVPGRKVGVGSVEEMLAQKAEWRKDKLDATKKEQKSQAAVQSSVSALQSMPIRRPGQQGGRRGGLGVKRGGAGLGFQKPGKQEVNKGDTEDGVVDGMEGVVSTPKSNADFKAMFLKGS